MSFDLIIIGGGPAGVAAGVYAARKKLRTLLLTYDFGGQSIVSADVQNWIGTKNITGETLAKNLESHVRAYESADFVITTGVKVKNVTQNQDSKNFAVLDDAGKSHETRAVLVATGAERRKLTVPGAREFEHRGITYCATCDGPLFADQDVVVIGGGNAAFETAAQLAAYCSSVTILHRSETFRADEITVEKIKQNPKVKIITNAELQEVKGDKFVTSLTYSDTKTGETEEVKTEGVFVEIGLIPTTYFVKDLVKLSEYGAITIVDHKRQTTSVPGVWAAGDCTDALYHQNNIAAGDAIKALEDIYSYLHLKS